MKWHKPTFSKFRLADVESVRTDIIDLECERLGDPQAAGRHQPEERVESMRPQGSCRRELLGFGEDCGDLGRCEDVRSTARTRVMSKGAIKCASHFIGRERRVLGNSGVGTRRCCWTNG